MSAIRKICPNADCRCPVGAEDVFCPQCGADLAPAVPLAAVSVRAKEEVASPAPAAEPAESPIRRELLFTESSLLETAPGDAALAPSECADLEVRYNNGCVFVNNMQSTFDLEISPRVDGIRGLSVEIWYSNRLLVRETPTVMARRAGKIHVALNYTPASSAGVAAFKIVVQYQLNHQSYKFEATKKHTIYSGKEDPRSVCDKLVVEIKNNIHQGHAGDVKVDQDFRSLKELVGQQNGHTLDKEFIELINRRAFWSELALQECAREGQGDAAGGRAQSLPNRLLVRPEHGPEVQWFQQNRLRLGRKRDCELMARYYLPDGTEDVEACRYISQFHAWIEFQGGAPVIADLGLRPGDNRPRPSTRGLWINGERIASGSSRPLKSGQEYIVALGDAPTPKQTPYSLKVRAWTLNELPKHAYASLSDKPNGDSPACVVIRPDGEGVNKTYVLFSRALCLGWVDLRWSTACLCLDNGALRFCDNSGTHLIGAGQEFAAAGMNFQIIDNAGSLNP